jgi:hypothetical protein
MQYIEVATLREKILHQIRTGEAIEVAEKTLEDYSHAVWHNGRAHAHNEDFRPNHDPQRERAELIQLTSGALTGVLASDHIFGTPQKLAEIAVEHAQSALDIINKK